MLVGIYVKSNLIANKRDDLCINDEDFETVWIEIENPKAKNILCCCAYRHPNSDISKFNDYFQMTLSNLAKENKLIAVMGDFNIDLLKYDSHTPSNDFVNMMFSYHFQPSILHPVALLTPPQQLLTIFMLTMQLRVTFLLETFYLKFLITFLNLQS